MYSALYCSVKSVNSICVCHCWFVCNLWIFMINWTRHVLLQSDWPTQNPAQWYNFLILLTPDPSSHVKGQGSQTTTKCPPGHYSLVNFVPLGQNSPVNNAPPQGKLSPLGHNSPVNNVLLQGKIVHPQLTLIIFISLDIIYCVSYYQVVSIWVIWQVKLNNYCIHQWRSNGYNNKIYKTTKRVHS